MDLWQGLLLISSIHLLAAASPGPDFVMVSQQTLSNGRKAGFLCSLGIALGLSVHILYSSFGLAAVIVGESLFNSRSMLVIVFSCIIGSLLYRLAVSVALNADFLGFTASDLNLITAVLVGLALIVPHLRREQKARKAAAAGGEA